MAKLKYSSLVFVSRSKHKLTEFRALLAIPDLQFSELDIPDLQDMNLASLAMAKVCEAKGKIREPFFVETTGLIIDAWKGLPGGLTRQFIDTVGVEGICKMLYAYKGEERIARAKTVICYSHEGNPFTIEGTAIGTIATEPQWGRDRAWDWDSIFIPYGHDKTYAQMSAEEKNNISMRRDAALKFKREYLSLYFEDDTVGANIHVKHEIDGAVNTQTIVENDPYQWDVFISHASEDKDEVARPLAALLRQAGLRIWLDENELTIGDSLGREIDQGLVRSRYGIVILSRHYFTKGWTQRELNALTSFEAVAGKKILPVLHKITHEFVLQYSPLLADRISIHTDLGIDQVAKEIIRAITISSKGS